MKKSHCKNRLSGRWAGNNSLNTGQLSRTSLNPACETPADGRLAQWQSASFTRKRPQVRYLYRPPSFQGLARHRSNPTTLTTRRSTMVQYGTNCKVPNEPIVDLGTRGYSESCRITKDSSEKNGAPHVVYERAEIPAPPPLNRPPDWLGVCLFIISNLLSFVPFKAVMRPAGRKFDKAEAAGLSGKLVRHYTRQRKEKRW